MTLQFTPCPTCARHVKQSDRVCPFCGANAADSGLDPQTVYRKGMSRSALFAAAAAAAVASTACTNAPQPLYGGVVPPSDASSTTSSATSTGTPTLDAAYGAVVLPMDAGTEDGSDSG